jgi:S-adenosylmethionine synthetase
VSGRDRLLTSESVTEGHPDKVADRIADAVLDALLAEDADARVACDALLAYGLVVVAGEITSRAGVDVAAIARRNLAEVGYTADELGPDPDDCPVVAAVTGQSPEIARGVAGGTHGPAAAAGGPLVERGAGDQGFMIGYATDETPELMPMPIMLSHAICRRLAELGRAEPDGLGPDGKCQVTVRYSGGSPVAVEAVVVSTQHRPAMPLARVREEIPRRVVRPALEEAGLWRDGIPTYVNPAGSFHLGGPRSDCGLTGRKPAVDTYGGAARHGGGALSGKDPSKVDRSGAYAARWVAKNVVAAGLARRCEVQVAYAIGEATPIEVGLECFGTERRPLEQVERWVRERFDLRPGAIVEALDLRRPVYRATAAYGHMGRRGPGFTWERTDPATA